MFTGGRIMLYLAYIFQRRPSYNMHWTVVRLLKLFSKLNYSSRYDQTLRNFQVRTMILSHGKAFMKLIKFLSGNLFLALNHAPL